MALSTSRTVLSSGKAAERPLLAPYGPPRSQRCSAISTGLSWLTSEYRAAQDHATYSPCPPAVCVIQMEPSQVPIIQTGSKALRS